VKVTGPSGEPAEPAVAYLDNACLGRLDSEVAARARAMVSDIESTLVPPTDLVVELYETYPRARAAAAALVGVQPERIALVESTSHALGMVAAAMPLRSGDNVLVCDLEFCPSALCWAARADTVDMEVRPVHTTGGRLTVSDFECCIDERTRAIVVSAVQEINGFRAPIAGLCRMAHAAGIMVIVDGVQEVGCLQVDLGGSYDECPDVYCAGGHKWLRNPFGTGFMCVHPHALDILKPTFYGYFNTAEPETGWGGYLASPERTPFDRLPIIPTAQVFETGGMGNFLGAAVLAASIEASLRLGVAEVEGRVTALGDRLLEGVDKLGLELRSSREAGERSGITAFGLPGGPPAELRLNAHLTSRRVYVSVRYTSGVGGVRISPHSFNTFADVDRLLDETAAWLALEKKCVQ